MPEIEPEAEAEAEAEACEFFDDVVVVFVVQHQCPPPRLPEKWRNVLITKTMMMLFPVAVVASFYTPLYLSKSNLLTLHDLILRGFIQKEISLFFLLLRNTNTDKDR